MKKKKKEAKPADRRVQKTKKLLSDALIALIIEKGFESVSIKDIIEKANVGRSTFYTHFEDKEQLLLWGHDTFKKLLTEDVKPLLNESKASCINFNFLYEHIQEQRLLISTLLGERGGEIAMEQLRKIFVHRITMYFGKKDLWKSEPSLFQITAHAAAAAMIALLVQWMEQEMPFSTDEMAKQSELLLMKMLG